MLQWRRMDATTTLLGQLCVLVLLTGRKVSTLRVDIGIMQAVSARQNGLML